MLRFFLPVVISLTVLVGSVLLWSLRAALPALPVHELTVTVRAELRSVPRSTEFGQQMIMRVDDPVSARHLQVFWPADNRVLRGDDALCWHLTLQLTALSANGNPGLPDRAAMLRAQHIDGMARVVDRASNRPCVWQPQLSMLRVRERLGQRIRVAVRDAQASAVLVALATGDRQYLSLRSRELFARTGTAHVMAISGMHIGLVAGCCFVLMRRWFAGCLLHGDALALLTSVLAGTCYAAMAGGALPTLRAVAMLSLAAVFRLARLRVDLLRLTLIAATVFALLDTIVITTPAFILSFAAVTALGLAQRRNRARHAQMPLASFPVIGAQTLLSVAMLPLVATLFAQVSVVSLGVNLMVLPVFALIIIPLLLVGIVVWPLSLPAANVLWQLAGLVCQWLLAGLGALLHWVPGWFATTGLHGSEALLACAMLLAAVLLAGWPARVLLLLAAPIALMTRALPQATGCVSAHMLSVGHGTAIVLAGAQHRWLYDTGPAWRSGGSAARHIVIPYLQRHWGGVFTRVVVSHGDNDHDGGVDELHQQARVQDWLGVPGSACVAGQRWYRDGVRFEVLWPLQGARPAGDSDNNASCVLRISTYDRALILFGDVERAAERELLSMGGLAASVSSMPHHGSNSSSTTALIAAVSPTAVIASAGNRRGWVLPHPDVLHRWQQRAEQVFVTHRHGAIQVKLCRGTTQVVTGVASL